MVTLAKIILFFAINAVFIAQSQAFEDKRVDSLKRALDNSGSPDQRLGLLIELANIYNRDNRRYQECHLALEKANAIASTDSNFTALAKIYGAYGVLYRNIAEYDKSLTYHNRALIYALRSSDKSQQASALNGIGVVYRRQDQHAIAAQYHIDALKLAEEIGDSYNISVSINSLGNIYSLSNQFQEAIKYFRRALSISHKAQNKLGIAINLNNIGEAYEFLGSYDSALVYYSKSLDANREIQSKKGIAISYNAVGKIYLIMGRVDEAYRLIKEALEIDIALGDKKFIADSYINLGRVYIAKGQLANAEKNLFAGLDIAKQIGSITHTQWALEELSKVFSKQQKEKKALEFYQKSIIYKDSLINEKNARAIAMVEVMYNMEKKQQEIELLKKNQEITQKELAKQKTLQYMYLIGLFFSLLAITLVYSALNIKRKANKELAQQKEEIEKRNYILNNQQQEILKKNEEINAKQKSIEQQNKHLEEAYRVIEGYIEKITDNIRYAQRIQKALLPPLDIANKFIADAFCFYKPKDFVSGDFYWMHVKGDQLFIAVADCTGHGVPGAFMSIVGIDMLNQAVNQYNISEPTEILDFLNIEIRKRLRKDEDEAILKDSLDIGILRFDSKDMVIHFSGALIPMIVLRNGKIIEHKASPVSIGVSNSVYNKSFKQSQIDLEANDWIYLFTDGYTDQFGGDLGTKLLRRKLYQYLTEVQGQNGKKQKVEIERHFNDWKGNNEQVDDVLVLGLNFLKS